MYFNITSSNTCELTFRYYYHIVSGVRDDVDYRSTYSGDVVVPKTVSYNGVDYTVTSIKYYTFSRCNLNRVILPSSIRSIGEAAFNRAIVDELIVLSSSAYFDNDAFDYASIKKIYAEADVLKGIEHNSTKISLFDISSTSKFKSLSFKIDDICDIVNVNSVRIDSTVISKVDGIYTLENLLFGKTYQITIDADVCGEPFDIDFSLRTATPKVYMKDTWRSTQTSLNVAMIFDKDETLSPKNAGICFSGVRYDAEYGIGLTFNDLKPDTEYEVYAYAIYDDIEIKSDVELRKTDGIYPNITLNVATPTTLKVKGSYKKGDATVLGSGFTQTNTSIDFIESDDMTMINLQPNTQYTFYYAVNTEEGGFYRTSKTVKTSAVELVTEQAQPTSTTSVRLMATTNLDDAETNVGFQWRRYDAPDEMPSTEVACPVVDGMIVGSLRNVNPDVYYKYRPYYRSSSGSEYFGDWVVFFTGDATVYFEPEVRTYEPESITADGAVLTGYALEGTDEIEKQGFEYWPVAGDAMLRGAAPGQVQTVLASGIKMQAELTGLAAGTTYAYRAFATTGEGTTYGTEMQFTTEAASGVAEVAASDADGLTVLLRGNPVDGGTAWVKVGGASGQVLHYRINSVSGQTVGGGVLPVYDDWNAVDASFPAGLYLLTVDDGLKSKTVKMIVR